MKVTDQKYCEVKGEDEGVLSLLNMLDNLELGHFPQQGLKVSSKILKMEVAGPFPSGNVPLTAWFAVPLVWFCFPVCIRATNHS